MPLAKVGLSVLGSVGFPMGTDQYRSLKFDNSPSTNEIDAFSVSSDSLTTLGGYLRG
jgi:NADH dehydrogenase